MTYVFSLVSSSKGATLTEKHFKAIEKIIAHYNLGYTGKCAWLDEGKAAEIGLSGDGQFSLTLHLRDYLKKDRIDFFITKNQNRRKKLLLADMDSTIVSSETLDELAAYAGIKDKIAQITIMAMEGKLDFHQALRERVGLLKGLPSTALKATLQETKLNKGARAFVKTMRANGATCVLVSGGFTYFTHAVAQKCGFQFDHGNILEFIGDNLSGRVQEPILDKYAKVDFLKSYSQTLELQFEDCLTIGDGANDLPMLKAAGLGIGFRPKEAVKEEIGNCILYGDLTTALYAQGYASKDFQNP